MAGRLSLDPRLPCSTCRRMCTTSATNTSSRGIACLKASGNRRTAERMHKARRRTLPLVKPPIPSGGGRIITAAGELAQIVDGDHFQFLVAIEFRYEGPASASRG